MKLEELLEMAPVFIDKEMPIITGATINFYSNDTLKDMFVPLSKDMYDGDTYFTLIAKDKSKAITGLIGHRKEDNKIGMFVRATVDFKDKPDVSYDRWIKLADNVIQVDSVEVPANFKRKGLGFLLYLALVKSGYAVISDYNQYRGGKALWKKLSTALDEHDFSIYVVDNGHPKLDNDGTPIVYDGKNIDDADIWSTHPDMDKYHVLLVAKKNVNK
jgi:hypothetical protein